MTSMAIIFMIKFFFRNVPKNPHKTVANTNNSSGGIVTGLLD
jgi:hypothetical protein